MLLSSQFRRTSSRQSEQGYILLLLLLTVCIMTIMVATAVTTIKFQIRRDREEEMVHRGVQYTRAIRAYYRKFNRFPAKIEDLENTNQLRFLRKRYKDPITGKDFKLVHFGEVKMAGSVMGGGMIPGANTVGANGALMNASQNSGFGNNTFGQSPNSLFGQSSNSGFGQASNSGFGQNTTAPGTQGQDAAGQNTDATQNANTGGAQNGSDSSQQGNGLNSNGAFGSNSGSDKIGTTQFGGAPIVGVASTSKEQTIREYDKKKKYNEWMFVYDPMLDRGGLIKTPYQPQLAMQAMTQGMQNVNGQNQGQTGTSNGFGSNGGFGNSSGFGNNNGFGNGFGNSPGGVQNNPPSPAGFGTPAQPPSNSPQQP
ncbi:MAG TPA: hypothetical protein VMP68_06510 [Candidatus Eisenbacteria bacterium]|nr:hypothetical protein [Candidatus Eisenbacteria bacterium]